MRFKILIIVAFFFLLSSAFAGEKNFPGIDVNFGITGIFQNTFNAPDDESEATLSSDLELEKNFSFGKIFVHIEAGTGKGLDEKTGYYFSPVNYDAMGKNISLSELYYEYEGNNLIITVGKLDPTCYFDQNEFANDETTQFFNGIFRNNQALEFPDNSPGIHILFSPVEKFEIEAGVLDSEGEWNDFSDFDDIFRSVFYFLQIGIKGNIAGKEGNYRIYGWSNTSDHTEWLNPAKTDKSNYGFGMSADQNLNEILGLFFRIGWQNEKVSESDICWSIGLNIAGKKWGRENDNLGIAFGQNRFSDDYKDAGNPGKTESVGEIYYNFVLNKYISVSPDVQIIDNAGGVDRSTITVAGLRVQINF